jgi:hypothetical protein
MADLRTSFTVLEDPSTQAGLPIHKISEGDAISGKNALPVIAFKDGGGNFRYPKVDASDRLLVTTEQVGASANLSARGELAAGSATMVDVTGASIDLVVDLNYEKLAVVVSCARDAQFQVVFVDNAGDPAEVVTVLADALVGAGCMTFQIDMTCLGFTAGSTGPQMLKVKGKNFNALSALRATIAVSEIQP